MRFKTYKFCQSATVTMFSSLYAAMVILSHATSLPGIVNLLIAAVATLIWFTPFTALFYPLAITGYFIAATVLCALDGTSDILITVGLFALHVIRFTAMLSFARKNPALSLEYDEAIRYGYDFDKLIEQ